MYWLTDTYEYMNTPMLDETWTNSSVCIWIHKHSHIKNVFSLPYDLYHRCTVWRMCLERGRDRRKKNTDVRCSSNVLSQFFLLMLHWGEKKEKSVPRWMWSRFGKLDFEAILSTSLTPQISLLSVFTAQGFVTCSAVYYLSLSGWPFYKNIHGDYTLTLQKCALTPQTHSRYTHTFNAQPSCCVQLVFTSHPIRPWALPLTTSNS